MIVADSRSQPLWSLIAVFLERSTPYHPRSAAFRPLRTLKIAESGELSGKSEKAFEKFGKF